MPTLTNKIPNKKMIKNWKSVLKTYKESDNFRNILTFIKNERTQGKIIFPEQKNIFNAFKLCLIEN